MPNPREFPLHRADVFASKMPSPTGRVSSLVVPLCYATNARTWVVAAIRISSSRFWKSSPEMFRSSRAGERERSYHQPYHHWHF